MKERKIALGIITANNSLLGYARQIAEEQNEDIQISSKALEEAVSVGKEMTRNGVEVIVSRGGTAHILRETLSIPILAIPLTSMDILKSIKSALPLGKKILLMNFRNQLSGIEIFEDLFSINLIQGVYYDLDSQERVISSARNQADVVIGGSNSINFAKKYGLEGVELQTSKETVASVIEDARSVASSRREDQKKAERYRCIIDATHDGIIAVDNKGLITTLNRTAKGILKISADEVTGKPITSYVRDSQIMKVLQNQKPMVNKLEKINGDLFVSNHIPIEVEGEVIGGVSTFQHVSNVIRAENEIRRSFAKGHISRYSIKDLIYRSKVMKDVIDKIEKFSATDSTVFISGETGTGKEIIAHSIHDLSNRRKGPFVTINCAAFPDQLLESELFGYEEGAFTGARKGGKPGLFELAHFGTIFLDEIGESPHNVQARLLRVLQEKEVMRIGGDRLVPVNVRVIAATNRNLKQAVRDGKMREDLFFRINMLNIHIPPLRERTWDIPILVNQITKKVSEKYDFDVLQIPEYCLDKLKAYSWPGNIRQLENFLERLVLLSNSKFDEKIFNESYQQLVDYTWTIENSEETMTTPLSLKEFSNLKRKEDEAEIIKKALENSKFRRSKTANDLGISRTTLWRKLKGMDNDL
jgi:transcriptional regulator, propionate catabolism operon regulatory protein